MTEENIIRAHDSGRCPFTTPEGYFEGFTEKLMQRLPAKEGSMEPAISSQQPPLQTAKKITLNPMRRFMRYAAAIIVAAGCLGVGIYLFDRNAQPQTETALAEDMLTDENLDEILDYEMLSNNQIAYYLTEAY